jgi:hypothetical protein
LITLTREFRSGSTFRNSVSMMLRHDEQTWPGEKLKNTPTWEALSFWIKFRGRNTKRGGGDVMALTQPH